MSKTDKVYYENSGKGDHRRVEDRTKIESNWDKIDWSRKIDTPAQDVDKYGTDNHKVIKTLTSVGLLKEENVCVTCLGKGGCFDAGWYYECHTCNK